MGFNAKQILLKSDFIGPIPEFRILDDTRYKSIFSSILSILLIIFSIVFIIYSFDEYLKQKPKVEYYKNNDNSTNKTFVLNDSLLMFQYYFFCISNFTVKPYVDIYLDVSRSIKQFTLEPCELGKNLNLKYKKVIEQFETFKEMKLKEFYCINYNNSNATLYSHPSLTSKDEPSLVFKIRAQCENYNIYMNLVNENDFIDHTKKDNPIVPYYKQNEFSVNNEHLNLIYEYQYIKYESDNGFFFNDKKTFNGIGVYGSNSFEKIDASNSLVYIKYKMNSANYDLYRRTFIKFQSFLADVMSLINLLISISKAITEFLLYKKMHKDIIKIIITNKEKEIIPSKKLKKIFDIDDSNIEKFEKKIEQNQIMKDKVSSKTSFETNNKDSLSEFENEDKNMIKVMKNLNFINIIKSFFCFKDKKLKLINLCDDIINKDICVERILRRLYILENEYNLLIKGDISKSFIGNDISKVKYIIKSINNDEENEQIKNKYRNFFKAHT